MATTATLELIMRLQDQVSRELRQMQRELEGTERKSNALDRALSDMGRDIGRGMKENIGHRLTDPFADATGAMADFVTGSLGAAGEYEGVLNRFAAVTGEGMAEAGKSLEDFSALFMEMGADTQFSSQQAADAAIELAKGGRSATQVYSELGDALGLASAGEVGLAEAAELSAKQLAIWENTGVRSADVADLLAQAANASTVGVQDLGIGLANVGGVAKVAGLSFEETVQAMAQLAPGFSSASDAGTSFKAFLNNMIPTTKPAIGAMRELGLYTDEAGSKFYDASGSFIGMEAATDLLYGATKDLSEAERALALETIFGSDAQRAAAILAEGGAEAYRKMGESMGKAGSATDQAAEKNKGYAFQLETLKGSLETFQIKLGQLLVGPATEFVLFLTDAVNGLTTLVDIVNQDTKATEENAESHSELAKILNYIPLQQVTAGFFEMRHQQRLADEEGQRLATTFFDMALAFGGSFKDGMHAYGEEARQAAIVTGELGRAGQLTAEELKTLSDELVKISEQGSAALGSAIQTQSGFLSDRENREREHLSTLTRLQAEGNAEQYAAEVQAHADQQAAADMAYGIAAAAQQAHLGEMLIQWMNGQLAMGNFTTEQADAFNETVATKYGVAADNVSLLFGKMTGAALDWGATGSTSADQVVGGFLDLQDEAANTQAKVDEQLAPAFARLRQELENGTITQAEYDRRLREIPGEVKTKVTLEGADKAKTDAIGLGYAISQGLATGVSNGKGLVAGAVTDAIAAGYAAGRGYAQVRSPSRLFAQGIGAPIAEGVAMGIDEGSHTIGNAITDAITLGEYSAVNAIDGLEASMVGAVGTMWQVVGQALAQGPPNGWSWDSSAVFGGAGGVIGGGASGGGWNGGVSSGGPVAGGGGVIGGGGGSSWGTMGLGKGGGGGRGPIAETINIYQNAGEPTDDFVERLAARLYALERESELNY